MTPASYSSTTYSPDKLFAGHLPPLSKKVTLLSGEANLKRGTVVGRISVGAAVAAAVAGNTGNGAFGAVTTAAGAKAGVYKVTCIEPAANAGKFTVEDPDGVEVGVATVAVAFVGPINFTIADGATDFIAGDSFTVTVADGTGKYKKAVAAAADGSQNPVAVLAEDCDATAADKEALIYTRGDFNENALILGAGHTLASIRDALRAEQINLIAAQGA